MKRLARAILLCLAGSVTLAVLFHRIDPTAAEHFEIGRSEAISQARAFAASQGMDTTGWNVWVESGFDNQLEYYRQRHPEDRDAHSLSPAFIQVVFQTRDKQRSFETTLKPGGQIASWEIKQPRGRHSLLPLEEVRRKTTAAFLQVAGLTAPDFRLVTEGAPSKQGLRFTWERMGSGQMFQPTIDVVERDGLIVHAETHRKFAAALEREYNSRTTNVGWWVVGHFVIFYIVVLAAAVLYTMGSLRHRVDHRFAIAVALVNLFFTVLPWWYGSDPQTFRIEAATDGSDAATKFAGIGMGFVFAGLLAWVLAGAGLSIAGPFRSKWWSLRLLVSRRLISKPVGFSLAAGVLAAPAWAAFTVLAGAVIPQSGWDFREKASIFAPLPELQPFAYCLHPTLLLFFAVLLPFLQTRIRWVWLRYALIVAVGLLFFGGFEPRFRFSSVAVLIEAALVLGLTLRIFRRFDLLAVLVAATGKTAILTAIVMLAQPAASLRAGGWNILAIVGTLFIAGLVMLAKAPAAVDAEAPEEPSKAEGVRTALAELQSDFGIARRAQREMLPGKAPPVPGFSLAATCMPALDVGGDLYDFLPMAGGRLSIAVADVSGKGVPAALYMTLTKGLLAATTQENLPLSTILCTLNGHLYTVGRRKTFVTMALGILDPQERTLEYARAGHNPVVWRRRKENETRLLSSRGLALGMTGPKSFNRVLAVDKMQLGAGDTVVFYSDGLTEAMNPDLEQFGEERLMQAVAKSDALTANGVLHSILSEVQRFLAGNHAQDDLTMVVLRAEEARVE